MPCDYDRIIWTESFAALRPRQFSKYDCDGNTRQTSFLQCILDGPANMMATHAKLKLQFIVEFITNAFDAHIQEKIIVILHSEGESDGQKLIVDYIRILHFKITQTNLDFKISFHFCDDCRILCEGEWEQLWQSAINLNACGVWSFDHTKFIELIMAFGRNHKEHINLTMSVP